MNVLAFSKNIGTDYYVNVPKERNLLTKVYYSIKNWKTVEFAGFKFERENKEQKLETNIERHTLYEKHPSAWIKNYNKQYPYCGFFRIWDYRPVILSDLMLEELYIFCSNISKELKQNVLSIYIVNFALFCDFK